MVFFSFQFPLSFYFELIVVHNNNNNYVIGELKRLI